MTRFAVVGGGIAGLATARRLARHGEVIVLEGARRFGGKLGPVELGPVELGGVRLDGGAESVLARRPEALELIAAVGLGPSIVHPTGARPALLVDGRLRSLPPSLQGVPADVHALGDLLTPAGWERARLEPDLPAPPLAGDVAIGRLVEERFGREVTDRLLEPLLGGVYAGLSRELSFAAVSGALYDAARYGGALSAHARAGLRTGDGPVFAGLVGGVATLVDALVADLAERGVRLCLDTTVRALAPTATGWALTTGATTNPQTVEADAVVLAAPAAPTGRLLRDVVPTGGRYAQLPYASMAIITVAVTDVELAESGLLVGAGELPTIKAATYSSAKWEWVAQLAARRWESGTGVVRFSVGRRGEEAVLQLPDDLLLRRTLAEAQAGIPGWRAARVLAGAVSRWGGGLPQYLVGHRDLVAALRADLAGQRGLAVCGAALAGVGIAACVASANSAADKVLADLG